MKLKSLIVAFSLFALTPVMALAGPMYNVNRTIGPGSVTGSIETDGTIGVLSTANVIGWNLTIDNGEGNGAFNLINPGNSVLLVGGSLLSATATNLLFDFSGLFGFALFQSPFIGSGQNWWCVEGINANCAGSGDSTESVNRLTGFVSVTHQGVVSIAEGANNVPEPASLALLGLGLLGLGVARKRK